MKKILIANRAAVAARVQRAAQALGLQTVVVYSEADRDLPYVQAATQSYCLGAAPAASSYLDQAAILDVMQRSGADGVHPGYGFLSENAEFARKVTDAGKCFIGPSWQWIETLGDKARARELMRSQGLPVGISTGVLNLADPQAIRRDINRLGYPVLIKPAKGGGGIGMIPAENDEQLFVALNKAASIAEKAFADTDLYAERFIREPRHIEFQFLADRNGQVVSLFERDCSTQRRYQKVIEEAPAPAIPREQVTVMAQMLQDILSKIRYDVIGTVEMLYSPATGFSFLEVNTRLQVEHAVTEAVTGVDIVQAQIQLASGMPMHEVIPVTPCVRGHAIEARLYAEDPQRFLPSPGLLSRFDLPQAHAGLRVETGYGAGSRVSSYYDPMVAKLIVHGDTREQAILNMIGALGATHIEGIKTNIPAILKVLHSARFKAGAMTVNAMQHVIIE